MLGGVGLGVVSVGISAISMDGDTSRVLVFGSENSVIAESGERANEPSGMVLSSFLWRRVFGTENEYGENVFRRLRRRFGCGCSSSSPSLS